MGVPVLFVAGVVFGYFVVLPAATKFLLNFNDQQFNIQIRAKDYYGFFTLTLAVMGLIFQLPIGILAITRLGILSPEQLSQNRRYAYVVLLVIAMLLPGTDPVTMLIELAPLIALYESSVWSLAGSAGRLKERSIATSPSPSRRPAGRPRRRTATLYASAVLFDLQTPRRRRVVRVVFGGLALIFAISFVFLGVGTGGGGFSFSDLFGGGGGSSSTAFDGDINAAEAKLAANPNDTTAMGTWSGFTTPPPTRTPTATACPPATACSTCERRLTPGTST